MEVKNSEDNLKEKPSYKKLLQNRGYFKIFLAGVISRFGDSLDSIAYSYMVFELTGSAVLMATLFAVNGLPSLLLNLISGVIVSYWPKKRVVIICDIGRGAVVIFTAYLYLSGQLEVWHLYVLTILNSTFEAFREPASSVMLLKIVPQKDMDVAVSLDSSAKTVAELAGFSSAAILIAVVGVSGAIFIDGITFILSALLILLVKLKKEELKKEALTIKQYFLDLKEGMGYALKNPLMRAVVLISGGIGFFLAPFNALQVPFVLDSMGLGEIGISVLSITFMVSIIIGSILVPTLSTKIGYRKLFVTGGFVIGIGYVLMGYAPVIGTILNPYISLILASFVMGFTLTFLTIPMRITLMKQVEERMMTRMVALLGVFQLASAPIGGAISGAIVSVVSMPHLFIICGLVVVAIFIVQSFNKDLEGFDSKESKNSEEESVSV